MNACDNETIRIEHVRGAVASDLHGAFSEWEAEARALSRCRNYLYSLSINPAQHVYGRLTRDQYDDYIDRVEAALGLAGQPRAVVFHEKEDRTGAVREHAHVVWSRIDTEKERAIPIAFDRSKLMEATRAFARDHDLPLPKGYEDWARREVHRGAQESAYDAARRLETGVSLADRRAAITDLWDRRDTPASFVRSLEDGGFLLATGRRDYVVVDAFGGTNALARLIDDRSVRVRTVREFLGPAFGPDDLPSVEDAQAIMAERRARQAPDAGPQARAEDQEALRQAQETRRAALLAERAAQAARLEKEQEALQARIAKEQDARREAYEAERRALEEERRRRDPKGLWGVLARATGYQYLRTQFQERLDRRADDRFHRLEREHAAQAEAERRDLEERKRLQAAEFDRRARALDLIEKRETAALERSSARARAATADAAPKPDASSIGRGPLEFGRAARRDYSAPESSRAIDKDGDYARPKPGGFDRYV